MGIMADAFAKARGEQIQAGIAKSRARQKQILYLPPRPAQRHPLTNKIRESIAERVAVYRTMDDDALTVERITVEQNISIIKGDLHAEYAHETQRGRQWQLSAERALAVLNAQIKLLKQETDERVSRERASLAEEAQKAKEQRELEHDRRREMHATIVAQQQERKAREAELKRDADRTSNARFVAQARILLPRETYLAIWGAVHAEELGDSCLA